MIYSLTTLIQQPSVDGCLIDGLFGKQAKKVKNVASGGTCPNPEQRQQLYKPHNRSSVAVGTTSGIFPPADGCCASSLLLTYYFFLLPPPRSLMDVAAQCYKVPLSLTAGASASCNRRLMVYSWSSTYGGSHTKSLQIPSWSVICWKQKQNVDFPRVFSKNKKKPYSSVKKEQLQQNVDLPPVLSKKKKKPYPIPITEIQRMARADKKLAQMGIEKPLEPPKNGLLAPELIPVAHETLFAWEHLIRGLAQLLHVIPVYACCECSEVHVAQTEHQIRNCQGATSNKRQSFHSWMKGSINDVLIPIESYHLFDPFGRRVKHETRFNYDRIPAIVELCIQAGVDIPGYPSRRRTKPIQMIGKKIIDRGGYLDDPTPNPRDSSVLLNYDTQGASFRFPPPPPADLPRIAQETTNAYETVGKGVRKLMEKYSVKACGYCPEVHVGPWGHDAKLCGEFKHQWRDGKHGWQDAIVDEVFPPNYVWHVRDPKGPPLRAELKRFYGKVPAVVEVCRQAGAEVPKKYKPMMRLDIVLPDTEEAHLVA